MKFYHIHSRFLVLFFFILLVSCEKNEVKNTTTQDNIDAVINSKSEFSLFAYGVKKSNLDIFTKGSGPFTFFIPTNDAFAKIGINNNSDIDKLDPLFLVLLISYHVQNNARSIYEIPEGPNAVMTSQTGIAQYGARYVKTGKTFINGVELLDQGVITANGIYYTINEIIYPPSYTNALVMMQSNDNYKLMVQAITKTNVTTSYTASPSTVFILSNQIMLANGYDSTTIANITGANADKLANTLKYHAIAQRVFKSDFKIGNYITKYTGNNVSIGGTTGNYTIKGTNNATPQPVGYGIAVGNGVYYTLNEMLKP